MVSEWHQGKEPYKPRGEMGTDVMRAIGSLHSTVSAAKAVRPRNRQPSELGKAASEGGWTKQESEKSKVVSEDKFHV